MIDFLVASVRRSPIGISIKRTRFKAKPAYAIASAGEGGAAGSRTLVQTSSNNAFYMLSFSYFVGMKAGEKLTYFILSSCYFEKAAEQYFFYPDIFDASAATPSGKVSREAEGGLIFLTKRPTSNYNRCHLYWREHCFCGLTHNIRHAYNTTSLLSKPVSPIWYILCKDTIIVPVLKNFPQFC
jgi:hypothetical protein